MTVFGIGWEDWLRAAFALSIPIGAYWWGRFDGHRRGYNKGYLDRANSEARARMKERARQEAQR
jgi:hypothetical protein